MDHWIWLLITGTSPTYYDEEMEGYSPVSYLVGQMYVLLKRDFCFLVLFLREGLLL